MPKLSISSFIACLQQLSTQYNDPAANKELATLLAEGKLELLLPSLAAISKDEKHLQRLQQKSVPPATRDKLLSLMDTLGNFSKAIESYFTDWEDFHRAFRTDNARKTFEKNTLSLIGLFSDHIAESSITGLFAKLIESQQSENAGILFKVIQQFPNDKQSRIYADLPTQLAPQIGNNPPIINNLVTLFLSADNGPDLASLMAYALITHGSKSTAAAYIRELQETPDTIFPDQLKTLLSEDDRLNDLRNHLQSGPLAQLVTSMVSYYDDYHSGIPPSERGQSSTDQGFWAPFQPH